MTQATERALVKVTTYIIYDHEWVIVRSETGFQNDTENRHYAGIRREWITDGRINRELNGIQMCVSNTVEEVINHITDIEELDYLIETTGMDATEACLVMFKKKMGIA